MEKIHYELLEPNHRTQLGLIVLQSDVTIEDEIHYYFADQPISLFVNRIPFENEVTPETLKEMENHLGQTMSLFPLEAEFDAMGYGCTSGAMHIGGDKISTLVSEHRPCKHVSNPLDAAIAAFKFKEIKKIAYLGPYSEEMCVTMINRFIDAGFEVPASASYDETEDRFVGRIDPESIKRDAINLAKKNPDVDAVFISCTNMKCADVIPQIEAETGIFALSSNQSLAWDLAQKTGLTLDANKGKLFQ